MYLSSIKISLNIAALVGGWLVNHGSGYVLDALCRKG